MAFALDIPSALTLKAEARALRSEREADGKPVSHAEALEMVAHNHGYRDWNTARAALPDRPRVPVQVGDRVAGTYLKQPFIGTVLGVDMKQTDHAMFDVTVLFDEPVDVVTFQSFSAFRQRVKATVGLHGVSPARTGDGEPHMRIRRE